jgi:endoglucanase
VPTPPAAIRIDQAGYETGGPKTAVLLSGATTPLGWTLSDS